MSSYVETPIPLRLVSVKEIDHNDAKHQENKHLINNEKELLTL